MPGGLPNAGAIGTSQLPPWLSAAMSGQGLQGAPPWLSALASQLQQRLGQAGGPVPQFTPPQGGWQPAQGAPAPIGAQAAPQSPIGQQAQALAQMAQQRPLAGPQATPNNPYASIMAQQQAAAQARALAPQQMQAAQQAPLQGQASGVAAPGQAPPWLGQRAIWQ